MEGGRWGKRVRAVRAEARREEGKALGVRRRRVGGEVGEREREGLRVGGRKGRREEAEG